jgi:hypothetical protein
LHRRFRYPVLYSPGTHRFRGCFLGPEAERRLATRLLQALDRVAELRLRHSRPAGHVQPRGLPVEILFCRVGAFTRRRWTVAVGSAPKRLAYVDEESSELACKSARMAVEHLFDVIEVTRHAASLPSGSRLDHRRLRSKGL